MNDKYKIRPTSCPFPKGEGKKIFAFADVKRGLQHLQSYCTMLLFFMPLLAYAQNDQNYTDSIWAYRQTVENKITLLKNEGHLLPLRELDRIFLCHSTTDRHNTISKYLERYKPALSISPAYKITLDFFPKLIKKEQEIIFILNITELYSDEDYKIIDEFIIQHLNFKKIIVCDIPFQGIARLKNLLKCQAIVFSGNDDPHTQDLTAQAIFGAIPFKGKLEEDISSYFKKGDGIQTQPLGRLKYTVPEEVGIKSEFLEKADSIAIAAIQQHATPSLQILVAKDGKVFYHKAFGHQTYDSTKAANLDDIYDLASVSKISTAIPALMKLTGEQRFSVDKTLSNYFSKARRSNKKEVVIRQVLTHQAGLRAWIPFWQNTLIDKTLLVVKDANSRSQKILDPKVFQPKKSKRFPFQVAENLFIHKKYYQKSIIKQILESPVAEKKEYVYSDLSYYLYPEVIKKLTKKDVASYLDENFYKPLGASTLTYNPLQKFDKSRIVPTEYDSLFRKQLIHGYVHDEGAAMLGGVSTHAGLFGNSNDLAKLLQMYLQNGYYGGKQYLSKEVLAEFTRCQFCPTNLRGIGFDRQRGSNAAKSVSDQSYGHSGFTGNLVWIDPSNGLLYILLSNRVYPTRNNNLLSDLNIRTGIQEVFYEALRK